MHTLHVGTVAERDRSAKNGKVKVFLTHSKTYSALSCSWISLSRASMRLMASPRTLLFFAQVLAQFAVFFFQRHLRGDSGLKFGMETTGLRQKLGFLFQKGPVPAFRVALVLP